MPTETERIEGSADVTFYSVRYPISAYTFPEDARIRGVRFDEKQMHLDLTDGRVLSVPLWWIPTLYNAPPEEREKYELDRTGTKVIWDPDRCAINDEVRLDDYLNGPGPAKVE